MPDSTGVVQMESGSTLEAGVEIFLILLTIILVIHNRDP